MTQLTNNIPAFSAGTEGGMKRGFIFFGTPEFSADILIRLVRAGFSPVAAVTNPDRPRGRKKLITPPPVKAAALGLGAGIDILQPEILDDAFAASLASHGAEFGVLAAYGKIVPKAVIDAFPKGIIVVHPSLLPKYRGATPIQAAILSGDQETGTTLFLMDEKVDHGPVLGVRILKIDDKDTYETLATKLSALSAELLIETLPRYADGGITPEVQDESRATYTKKLMAEGAFIDPAELARATSGEDVTAAEKIVRMARALNPEPGTWTMYEGQPAFAIASARRGRVKILEADLVDGKLVLKKIQFEGGKPITL